MKERGILFSAPMVRALLAGTKRQTRRICKAAKHHDDGEDYRDTDGWPLIDKSNDGAGDVRVMSPYGVPGDRLWVKETHGVVGVDGDSVRLAFAEQPGHFESVRPGADAVEWAAARVDLERWRPSIFMPRWASRITLDVTEVRVERLQDISEADALAEGVLRLSEPVAPHGWGGPNRFTISIGSVNYSAPTAAGVYRRLWEQINGAGSWDANPWVWVVGFADVREARAAA